MALLGVLLGITITVLAGAIWYGKRERDDAWEANERRVEHIARLEERVEILERRKAVIPLETTPTEVKVAARTGRRWTEDIKVEPVK